jgi:hypothetical protein
MGQRGQLDKLPVAHTASVTSLDWYSAGRAQGSGGPGQSENIGLGWLVSGGFDRCVKVSNQSTYIFGEFNFLPRYGTSLLLEQAVIYLTDRRMSFIPHSLFAVLYGGRDMSVKSLLSRVQNSQPVHQILPSHLQFPTPPLR